MTPVSPTCTATHRLAPELALGVLSGAERGAALDHALACGECGRFLDDLAVVADGLLLLAPEDEPPAGFETGVMARLAACGAVAAVEGAPSGPMRPAPPTPDTRRRRRRVMAVAAALVLAVSSVATGVAVARRADRHSMALTHEYVAALQALGGTSLRAAGLRDGAGKAIGQVFVYDGSPSWIFVSVDRGGLDGDYVVELSGPAAGLASFPALRVTGGQGSLGRTAGSDLRGLVDVRVIDPGGHVRYHATVEPGDDR